MKKDISVVIITLNEEQRLEDCLRSVLSISDDIVVIDSGSTDRTVEIAQKYTSKVYHQPWLGDGPQRQFGVGFARHDWILNIDADERLAEGGAAEVSKQVAAATDHDAYYMKRKSYLHGRWIKHCGWYPDYIPRLFKKDRARFSENQVHTRIIASRIGYTNITLDHYPFQGYSHMLKKLDSYSSTLALEMFRSGRKIKSWQPLTHGLWMFLRIYVLKHGFLDGVDGMAIASTGALGTFMKYAKVLELQAGK